MCEYCVNGFFIFLLIPWHHVWLTSHWPVVRFLLRHGISAILRCVDGVTFSPVFLYSISTKFLLLITKEREAYFMSDGTADLYAKRNKTAKAA